MKIDSNYAVIETAEEAVLFQSMMYEVEWSQKNTLYIMNWRKLKKDSDFICLVELILLDNKIRVTPSQLWEVIKPVEGEACFYFKSLGIDKYYPYYERYDLKEIPEDIQSSVDIILKANALTTGKTVGELRHLVNWCKKSVDNN